MKKILKKNQIIITVLALMIAVAGYINYSDGIKKKSAKSDKNDKEVISNDVENDEAVDISNPGNTVFTSGATSAFIVSAKLEREQMRASNKEALMELVNNQNLTESEKAAASAKIMAITDASQKEVAAELMLEAKGFKNVIVSISDNMVDVVVEKQELTETERAQIEDIVKRKTDISVSNMSITSVVATDN